MLSGRHTKQGVSRSLLIGIMYNCLLAANTPAPVTPITPVTPAAQAAATATQSGKTKGGTTKGLLGQPVPKPDPLPKEIQIKTIQETILNDNSPVEKTLFLLNSLSDTDIFKYMKENAKGKKKAQSTQFMKTIQEAATQWSGMKTALYSAAKQLGQYNPAPSEKTSLTDAIKSLKKQKVLTDGTALNLTQALYRVCIAAYLDTLMDSTIANLWDADLDILDLLKSLQKTIVAGQALNVSYPVLNADIARAKKIVDALYGACKKFVKKAENDFTDAMSGK